MVYIKLAAVFIFFRNGIGKIQFQEMIRVVNVRVVTITPLSHSYVCPASISARVLCVLTYQRCINAKEFQDSNKSLAPYSTVVSGFFIYICIALCQWINLSFQSQLSKTYFSKRFSSTLKGIGSQEVEKSGLLYIQKNFLDALKSKHVTGQKEITFKVDDSFQYGQDNAQKNRWLTFMKKARRYIRYAVIHSFLVV